MPRGTRLRNVRVGDELWSAAKAIAAARGETLTDVIVRALNGYVRRHRDQVTPSPQSD